MLLDGAENNSVKRRAHHALGIALRLAGDAAAALGQQQAALALIDEEDIRASRERMFLLTELGLNRLELGHFEEALDALEQARGVFEASQSQPTPERADALLGLGRRMLVIGRRDATRVTARTKRRSHEPTLPPHAARRI